MSNVKLIADGEVLIETFDSEAKGIRYMHENRSHLSDYYSNWEVVTPGEETIWPVSDTLYTDEKEYLKKRMEEFNKRYLKEHGAPYGEVASDAGWGDE